MERTEDRADDEEERDQGRGRDAPRIARGCIDASTELWGGGCRVLGSLFTDLADAVTRPQAVRRRRPDVDQPRSQGRESGSAFAGCGDNCRDVVDAVLTSVGNSVSGAADTVQRSLDSVAENIAPESDDDIDESAPRERARTRKAAADQSEDRRTKTEPKKE
jgi:hypothetical protein